MRLFLAIDFPNRIKKRIYENVSILKSYIPKGIKWVEEENLHITFKFLGEVQPSLLDEICNSVQKITDRFPPFKTKFGKIEVVPNYHNPRVIWYDIIENNQVAQNIFKEIESNLNAIGFEKSHRSLKLHSTLGRIRFVQNIEWEKIIAKTQKIIKDVPCSKLTLFRSQLTPKGPIYTVEKIFLLNRK
ncbi:MAG: RNA 2',3'-cyclic phosphodiesterase [Candidatus Cloacimonadota bacterium]|nr:RNA 2',3'-cyclic phosphodiesterase [Candidatus Cloacimonadota bacterium]